MVQVGDKFNYRGKTLSVMTIRKDGYITGSTGVNAIGFNTAAELLKMTSPISSKTLKIVSVKDKSHVPSNMSTMSNDGFIQMSKGKSKNFYTIAGVIALIIIYFNTKIFKKMLK